MAAVAGFIPDALLSHAVDYRRKGAANKVNFVTN